VIRGHNGRVTVEPPVPADRVEVPPAGQTAHETEIRLTSEIYGLIVASSVLAAGAEDDDIVHVSMSVLVTLVVYWLAETYAHAMAVRHVKGQRIGWAEARHDLRAGWPLVSASFVPLIAVVITAVLGASVSTAQTVGLVCATLLLFSSGWVAGRRGGLTGFRLLLSALIAAAFGVALIGLKAALH
jgi:hypothetical protein